MSGSARTAAFYLFTLLIKALAVQAKEILHNAGYSASLQIYSGNPRLALINETDEWEQI